MDLAGVGRARGSLSLALGHGRVLISLGVVARSLSCVFPAGCGRFGAPGSARPRVLSVFVPDCRVLVRSEQKLVASFFPVFCSVLKLFPFFFHIVTN